jgi:hypothetical protein
VAIKPLLFSDITRRLEAVGYQLVPGPDGLRTFTKTIPPYFPYPMSRTVALPVEYADDEIIPAEVVDNMIIHLWLTGDEDEAFWANDPPVH